MHDVKALRAVAPCAPWYTMPKTREIGNARKAFKKSKEVLRSS